MSQSSLSESDWASKSEKYMREKAHIRQILSFADGPLKLAAIANQQERNYDYVSSDLCRRLRELVKESDIVKHDGNVATWELIK